MMLYFKCAGAALMLVSALLISKKYDSFCGKKLIQCQQILSFLRKIRKNISLFLLPVSKWKDDICDSTDACCGFFSYISGGANLKDAFALVKEKLLLPSEAKNELKELFSDFGKGYVNEELSKLDHAIKLLSDAEIKIRDEIKNDTRAVKALIIASALGLVILFI